MEYTIHFSDGGEKQYSAIPFVSNRVRAEIRSIEVAKISDDLEQLNKLLHIILATTDDFSEADPNDTDAVILDFFGRLSPKTQE